MGVSLLLAYTITLKPPYMDPNYPRGFDLVIALFPFCLSPFVCFAGFIFIFKGMAIGIEDAIDDAIEQSLSEQDNV